MSNQITAYDLHCSMQHRRQKQRECFIEILEKCYTRIRRMSANNQTQCKYEVPHFLVGKPRYDVATCTSFLVRNLSRNGFTVHITPPCILHVSWNMSAPVEEEEDPGFAEYNDAVRDASLLSSGHSGHHHHHHHARPVSPPSLPRTLLKQPPLPYQSHYCANSPPPARSLKHAHPDIIPAVVSPYADRRALPVRGHVGTVSSLIPSTTPSTVQGPVYPCHTPPHTLSHTLSHTAPHMPPHTPPPHTPPPYTPSHTSSPLFAQHRHQHPLVPPNSVGVPVFRRQPPLPLPISCRSSSPKSDVSYEDARSAALSTATATKETATTTHAPEDELLFKRQPPPASGSSTRFHRSIAEFKPSGKFRLKI